MENAAAAKLWKKGGVIFWQILLPLNLEKGDAIFWKISRPTSSRRGGGHILEKSAAPKLGKGEKAVS